MRLRPERDRPGLRLWLGYSVVAVALAGAAAALAQAMPLRSQSPVACSEIIDWTRFPYPNGGYRLVLGAISAPPAHLHEAYQTLSRPWTYFMKSGLVIGKGVSVTVTVPEAWRQRAAISWGNGSRPVVHVLRIAACPDAPNVGHAYAGGFYLRSPSACLPLVFRVGKRSAVVYFGIGRSCPAPR